jgi:hypothetical protein
MFVFITVIYKGFSISVKFRPELVVEKVLIKAVFFKITSFDWVIKGLNEKKTELIIKNIKSVPEKEAIILYLTLKKKICFKCEILFSLSILS